MRRGSATSRFQGLSEFYAVLQKFLEFRIIWKNPHYFAFIEYDFVGDLKIFEYATKGLILDLLWQAFQ